MKNNSKMVKTKEVFVVEAYRINKNKLEQIRIFLRWITTNKMKHLEYSFSWIIVYKRSNYNEQ